MTGVRHWPHPCSLVAHRGWPARYPENTLEGLQAAVAAGACNIEFDVQLSADFVPVVIHDDELHRLTGRAGRVSECEARQLCAMPVDQLASRRAAGAATLIPSLSRVVSWLAGQPQVRAFVEIKTDALRHAGHARVLAKVQEVLDPVREQVVLISFSRTLLQLVGTQLPTGWVLPAWDALREQQAYVLSPNFLVCNRVRLPSASDAFWAGPWQWMSYKVEDAAQAVRDSERGVILLETDDIGTMLEAART